MLLISSGLYIYRGVIQIGWNELIWELRFSALLCAIATGIALSLAGLILQSYFRNPLAGPYVMGSASGASLGVALALFILPKFMTGHLALVPFAMLGSLSTTLGIILLSRKASSMQILVAGMLFAQVCSALVSIMVRFGNDSELRILATWNQASFQALDLNQTVFLTLLVLGGIIALLFKSLSMDAMLLGEIGSQFTGHFRSKDKVILLSISSLLTAFVVSFCGPISFVGIITPLLVQKFLKSSRHILLIPANALLGALMAVLVLHGQEWGDHPLLPLDAVASLFSVPFLLVYLAKSGVKRA